VFHWLGVGVYFCTTVSILHKKNPSLKSSGLAQTQFSAQIRCWLILMNKREGLQQLSQRYKVALLAQGECKNAALGCKLEANDISIIARQVKSNKLNSQRLNSLSAGIHQRKIEEISHLLAQ
jgi:hypothetical protein